MDFKTKAIIRDKEGHFIWKQPKCPSTDNQIKKIWCTNRMDYDLAIKKNEMLPFVDSIDEPTGYYGK